MRGGGGGGGVQGAGWIILLFSRGGAVEFPDEDSDAAQHGVNPLLTGYYHPLYPSVYSIQIWV